MQPAEYQYIASTTVSTTDPIPVGFGLDIFGLISHILGGNETSSQLLNFGGIVHFLSILWNIYVVLAFLVSILMLVLYAYASTRRWQYYALGDKELRDAEVAYDEMYRGKKKSNRLEDVYTHSSSNNPNDWKLAIIEADIILDDLLKQRGYVGASLGERLRSISPQQLSSLNDAWEAHKVRNRIAHEGADFVLTQRLVQETIARYQRVFSELGE